jgi:hypothetical protein
MGARVVNLAQWGRHIVENVRSRALRSPDPRLDELIAELQGYLPPRAPGPDHIGFAVPLRLRCDEGELRLITTSCSPTPTWCSTSSARPPTRSKAPRPPQRYSATRCRCHCP